MLQKASNMSKEGLCRCRTCGRATANSDGTKQDVVAWPRLSCWPMLPCAMEERGGVAASKGDGWTPKGATSCKVTYW